MRSEVEGCRWFQASRDLRASVEARVKRASWCLTLDRCPNSVCLGVLIPKDTVTEQPVVSGSRAPVGIAAGGDHLADRVLRAGGQACELLDVDGAFIPVHERAAIG